MPRDATRTIRVVDQFCGAGGWTTGLVRAAARAGVDLDHTGINHWPTAIATLAANHPAATVLCGDIEAVRPEAAVPGGHLDLLIASPVCTHHSVARGGKPTSDQQRADAWIVPSWCSRLTVDRVLLENVPEWLEWGPVDAATGKPDKRRRGEFFHAWRGAMIALGYEVDARVLSAADYGAVTTRRRAYVQCARVDSGARVRWPAPTHRKSGGGGLFALPAHRPAREIIDWSLPGRSIFGRKQPLAPSTLARILAGGERLGWPEAFLIVLRQNMDGRPLNQPLPTITAEGRHLGLAQLALTLGQHSGAQARSVDRPVSSLCTTARPALIEPILLPYYGTAVADATSEPLATVTTKGRFGLATPQIIQITHSRSDGSAAPGRSWSVDAPLPTITTAKGGELALAVAQIAAGNSATLPRVMVSIDGAEPEPAYIDILYRMLQPHELAAAMGLPGYILHGTKTDQIKQLGNAVEATVAEALITAAMGWSK